MPSGPPLNFPDFHGGLNVLDAPHLLADNQARDLINVQGTVAGAIVKRTGLQTFVDPEDLPVALSSLFALESISPDYLIGADGSHIYSISRGAGVHTLASGLFARPWECISAPAIGAQGPLYMMNGIGSGATGPQQCSNGTGASAPWTATDAGGSVPNGAFCVYVGSQVYVAGVGAFPSRVYASGLKDPTAWNPANLNGSASLDLDPNDGQQISGIGVVGPYVLAGKPRKLWVIIDPIAPSVRQLSSSVGISSHRSIANAPEGTYFLAGDGVYLTNGTSLKRISDKIRPILDAIPAAHRASAAGVFYGGHYYLSFCDGTTGVVNNVTFDYDTVLDSWWKHSFGINQFANWTTPTGIGSAIPGLYGANQAGFVDQCFVPGYYQDHDASFAWAWRGPWQSPSFYRRRLYPSTWYRKRLRQIRIEGFGTVDYSLAKDFVTTEALIRPNCLSGGSGPVGQVDVFSLGVARAFSQVFSATSSTQDEVLQYTLALTDRVDRWD